MNRNTKMILIAIIGVLAIFIYMMFARGINLAQASTSYVLCHHTPGNKVTLTFQNHTAYNNHKGLPHSGSTFDTEGPCYTPSPIPSVTPSPSPSPSASASATPIPSWSPSPSTTPDPTPCIQFVKEFPEPCPSETPLPTPEVTPEPTPGQGSSDVYNPSTGPADCTDVAPTRVPANFHMLRNGKLAQVKWLPDVNPEGNKVQLFWGVNGQGYQSSLVTGNDGFVEINLYDTQDYTFWAQVLNGCAAGPVTKAVVDGGTDHWVLFR